MNGRIEESWLDYRRRCVPPAAGENQRIETERAFWAGAISMRSIMAQLLEAHRDDETVLQVELDMIQAECMAFLKHVIAERETGGRV